MYKSFSTDEDDDTSDRPGFFRRVSERLISIIMKKTKNEFEYDNKWREQQLGHCTNVIADCPLPYDRKSSKIYFPRHIARTIADFTVPNVKKRTCVKSLEFLFCNCK